MGLAPLINVGAGFRATRQGFHNDYPDFPATKDSGNGVLTNLSDQLLNGDPNQKIWLFVTGVATGWKVQGGYAQTQSARTFYPQHLSQDEMVIQGQCANQYEYDRLVEFVTRHHVSAIGGNGGMLAYERSTGDGGAAVAFRLVPYSQFDPKYEDNPETDKYTVAGDQSRAKWNTPLPIDIEGYITTIKAGAERFKNAPTFELRMKVTNDKLQEPWQTARVGGVLFQQYLGQFGPFYQEKDAPVTGDTPFTGGGATANTLDAVESSLGSLGDDLGDAVDAAWDAITKVGGTVSDLFRNES